MKEMQKSMANIGIGNPDLRSSDKLIAELDKRIKDANLTEATSDTARKNADIKGWKGVGERCA